MSDQDKLQKLLRLKNYETPGEEYFANFLDELKERQRQDALKQSFFGFMKDRMLGWYEDLGAARWAVPAVSLAAVLLGSFALIGKPLSENEPASENWVQPGAKTRTFELRIPQTEGETLENMPETLTKPQGSVLPADFGGFPE